MLQISFSDQSFKASSAWSLAVSDFFKYALWAPGGKKTFFEYFNMSKWPEELHNVRGRLLRTTIMDKDLMQNQGNDDHVLPALLNTYGRHFPAQGDAIRRAKSPIGKPLTESRYCNNQLELLRC